MGNFFADLTKKLEKYQSIRPKMAEIKEKSTTTESTPSNSIKNTIEEGNFIENNLFIKKVEGNPYQNYILVKQLFSGVDINVFLIRHKETNLLRVLKQIPISEDLKVKDINNQINILKKIDHPYVIKIYEYYTYNNQYYLVLEYCRNGELFDMINLERKFDENRASFIIYQLLEAVNYCHKNNITHRNLCPENIFVENIDFNGLVYIKVGGFGSATIFENGKYVNKVLGSTYYIAPEVLNRNYNEKCDVWSTGIILFILFSLKPPFDGYTDEEIINKIKTSPLTFNEKLFKNVSKEAIDLIKKLLDKNHETRLSAEEALNHPWFEKHKIKEKLLALSDDRIKNFISNLKNYKSNYNIRQATLAFIIHNLPHTENVRELEIAFRLIDKNGDGRLTKQELIEGLVEIRNITTEEAEKDVENIFKNVDYDKNGYLQYEEFICACIDKNTLLNDNYLMLAFNFFDNTGLNYISLSSLRNVLSGGGNEEEIDKLLKQEILTIDKDGDDKISYETFKKMMETILV